ncbi:MAG: hypothetical protein ACI9CD_001270 [Candidatus Deianiraeaceae bacterium]|jgi:hypothetical protein
MFKKVIIFRIGHCINYDGNIQDKPIGNSGYLKGDNIGHELSNFRNHNGYVYGYAPVRNTRNSTEATLGLLKQFSSEKIESVTVLWYNFEPYKQLVGWYENATVYSKAQTKNGNILNGQHINYYVKAKYEDAYLLPVPKRIRYSGQIFGQSNVHYPQKNRIQELSKTIKNNREHTNEHNKTLGNTTQDNADDEEYNYTNTNGRAINALNEMTRETKVRKAIPQDICNSVFQRAQKRYSKIRCENKECNNPQPFSKKDNSIYLEFHHIQEVSDKGKHEVNNLVLLCPNCHSEVHCGKHREKINNRLRDYAQTI